MKVWRMARLLTLLLLTGCIVLPVPIPPRGTRVDQEAPKLVIGETTRADLRALLGPPTHAMGERYDVWTLERDPFHISWIIAFAYGPAGVERSSEPIGYSLVTVYDDAERVAEWRWVTDSGLNQSSHASAPVTPPLVPIRQQEWSVDQVIPADDGTALLINLGEPGRVAVERRDLADGRTLEAWIGEAGGCGQPMNYLPGRVVDFALVADELVGVQKGIVAPAALCRWRFAEGGRLDFADGFLGDANGPARLARDLVVHRRPGPVLAVSTLAGEQLVGISAQATLIAVSAGAGAQRLLIVTAMEDRYGFWFFRRGLDQLSELPAMSATTTGRSCAVPTIALAPDGRTAAIACTAHLQLWTIAEDSMSSELLDVLPIPPGIEPNSLAFSADGTRLVVGSNGLAVWRTADWSLEAVLPRPEPYAWIPTAVGLSLTSDGSGVAASTGFWRLAAAVEAGS
jgi:hypothetical protein